MVRTIISVRRLGGTQACTCIGKNKNQCMYRDARGVRRRFDENVQRERRM